MRIFHHLRPGVDLNRSDSAKKGARTRKWNKRKAYIKSRFVLIIAGTVAVLLASTWYTPTPELHYVQEVKAEEEEKMPAVLKRIAQCESGDTHYDSNGQVLVRGNKNRSVDVGRYQINSVWFEKATELKLNVFDEEDNQKMAEWIFENRGTEDWYLTKKCWK